MLCFYKNRGSAMLQLTSAQPGGRSGHNAAELPNTMSLVARLLAPQDLLLDLLFPGAFDHETPPQPQHSAVRIYLVDTNIWLYQ